ncbi:unnamed protein product [Ilex paraguariensis]|uniref:VQ domain-containing protein n=1 Tax=Ilex paraguariensis TaxID=185542 RepID=A0ABC8TM14_9AQUA
MGKKVHPKFEITGKKVSQASLKISKNDKKQINSLIKVLRPKVYITDSSSFKRLVQELTGNGSPISSPPPPSIQSPTEQVPDAIDIEDQSYPESGDDFSFDLSELCFIPPNPFTILENLPEPNIKTSFTVPDRSLEANYDQMELSQYREMESWLLEIEPIPFYDTYASIIQQDVCVYDYDLSGLL